MRESGSGRKLLLLLNLMFFTVLCYDTYTYSIGDAWLGLHFEAHGASSAQVASLYGALGSANIVGSVGFMLLVAFSNSFAAAVTASTTRQLVMVCVLVAASLAASGLITGLPGSFPAFMVARSVQGLCAGIYYLELLVLIVLAVPRPMQLRAIACMNSGLSLGDSMAPFVGGILFDFAGAHVAAASTVVVCIPALACAVAATAASTRSMQPCSEQLPDVGSECSRSSSTAAATGKALQGSCGLGAVAALELSSSDTTAAKDVSCQPGDGFIVGMQLLDDSSQCSDEPPAAGADCTPAAVLSGRLLWLHARDRFVLAESGLVLTSQALRQLVDILLPLVMVHQRLWVVALLYASETVGSMTFPFVLDWGLSRRSQPGDTHLLLLGCTLAWAGVGASMLWLTDWLAAMFVVMLIFGALHSGTETLVCSQLAGHLRGSPDEEEDAAGISAASYSGMCIFSVAFALGYTIGAYLIGVVSHDDVRAMRLLATGVSIAVGVYAAGLVAGVRLGVLRSREWAGSVSVVVPAVQQ